MGSVGVIISSVLIEQFGLQRADPICSLFIAMLIFASVVPLLKESALVIALRTPRDIQDDLGEALKKVNSRELSKQPFELRAGSVVQSPNIMKYIVPIHPIYHLCFPLLNRVPEFQLVS